jgi:UDP-glucose 4-epimerase
MRMLVTGGAGFVGHHLVRALLARGHEVNVIDDFSTGQRSRLDMLRDRIALTEGSILDPAALDEAVLGCQVIFHEAAIASVERSLAEPRMTNEVNAGGTIEVMLAATRHHVRRVVFAGSCAVYGVPEALPCPETERPDPRSPYAASKLAAEHFVHTLGELHRVETATLRYFNVFGPGQDPGSQYSAVVPRFVTAVLENRRPTINGSGEISRDYVYIDNVVEANLLASQPSSPSGLTCNIGSGSRYSLLELLQTICDVNGSDLNPVFGPPRPGDIQHSQADISLARQALGYHVAVPFKEGIIRTMAWYRDQEADAAVNGTSHASDRTR